MTDILSRITTGKVSKPIRALLYGVEGIGKSTFAAHAPKPIFLGSEDGTSELDIARFPEPKTWAEVFFSIAELGSNDHDFKTLVIDTLDWLEPLCWDHLCQRPDAKGKRRESIEDFGYGKGYSAALEEWRKLVAMIERVRAAKSMHLILLAHSWIKPFKNPDGDDYDRYELKLHPKAGGLIKEWCDCVLFANYETFTDDSTGRSKGVSTGRRVMHSQRTAAWDAKNRYTLPETMELSWPEFANAVRAHRKTEQQQEPKEGEQ
jgi:hypothetical protein